MTLITNRSNDLKLLDEMQLIPKVIETEAEYEQNLAVVEKLIAKKNQRTPEETTLFRLRFLCNAWVFNNANEYYLCILWFPEVDKYLGRSPD